MKAAHHLLFIAAAVAALGASPLSAQAIGSFSYVSATDPASKEDRSSVATSGYNDEGRLVWKCDPGGLSVLLSLGEPVTGSAGKVRVESRFGGAAADAPQQWALEFENRFARLPAPAVAAFTQRAKGANEVAVRVMDANGRAVRSYQFTLNRTNEALQRLKCAAR